MKSKKENELLGKKCSALYEKIAELIEAQENEEIWHAVIFTITREAIHMSENPEELLEILIEFIKNPLKEAEE